MTESKTYRYYYDEYEIHYTVVKHTTEDDSYLTPETKISFAIFKVNEENGGKYPLVDVGSFTTNFEDSLADPELLDSIFEKLIDRRISDGRDDQI